MPVILKEPPQCFLKNEHRCEDRKVGSFEETNINY